MACRSAERAEAAAGDARTGISIAHPFGGSVRESVVAKISVAIRKRVHRAVRRMGDLLHSINDFASFDARTRVRLHTAGQGEARGALPAKLADPLTGCQEIIKISTRK